MRRVSALRAVAAMIAVPLAAQEHDKKPEASVTGKWTMTVHPDPHGMTMGLVLEQKGTTVTGTFASPHGDMPVTGEFLDGRLKLATTAENAESQITFDARLTDEHTLAGYLSSQMGDMKWTAERVKDKP